MHNWHLLAFKTFLNQLLMQMFRGGFCKKNFASLRRFIQTSLLMLQYQFISFQIFTFSTLRQQKQNKSIHLDWPYCCRSVMGKVWYFLCLHNNSLNKKSFPRFTRDLHQLYPTAAEEKLRGFRQTSFYFIIFFSWNFAFCSRAIEITLSVFFLFFCISFSNGRRRKRKKKEENESKAIDLEES